MFLFCFFFFFNDTATTEIYTLSLHDALPIRLMRFRYESPSHLVDLRNLRLSGIDEFGGRLRIGATTTDTALETSPTIRHDYPLIADVARVIADPLIRNLATIGGS